MIKSFYNACKSNDLELVKVWYAELNCNKFDFIHGFKVTTNLEIVQFLYNSGIRFINMIHHFTSLGLLDIVQFLVENGEHIGDSIRYAKNLDIVKYLHSKNGNLDLALENYQYNVFLYAHEIDYTINNYILNNVLAHIAWNGGSFEFFLLIYSKIDDIESAITDFVVSGLLESNRFDIIRFLESQKLNLFDIEEFSDERPFRFDSNAYSRTIPKRMYNDNTLIKIEMYINIKNTFDECLKRIHYHPCLERTITENLVKFREMENVMN